MIPNLTRGTLADIPIFDWHGPQFLAFYIVAYVATIAWTLHLGKARMKRFNRPGPHIDLEDPFEVAYLTGGSQRAVKLAVGRLIHSGLISWSKRWFGDRLVATHLTSTTMLHALEMTILTQALGHGERGMPIGEVQQRCAPILHSMAVRLAVAGLRPTEVELKNSALSCLWPLPLLLLIGFIKLFIGISRHRPIGFLMIAMAITFISIFIMAAIVTTRSGRLTASGKQMIEKLRARHPMGESRIAGTDLNVWSFGLALAGTCAMTGIPGIDDAYTALNSHSTFAAPSTANNGGGGGCGTSGCGSSGGSSGCGSGGSSCGGGGGCGGCGGGGD